MWNPFWDEEIIMFEVEKETYFGRERKHFFFFGVVSKEITLGVRRGILFRLREESWGEEKVILFWIG